MSAPQGPRESYMRSTQERPLICVGTTQIFRPHNDHEKVVWSVHNFTVAHEKNKQQKAMRSFVNLNFVWYECFNSGNQSGFVAHQC